ncbi:MAG: hypothetical protein KC649_03750, partial [Candidatus Omnitrophica bacterium]|nr:hypothetical protein [Candidatus Omnitrophota bacterium]
GISKISYGLYQDICGWADQLPSPTPFHYEDALTVMSKSRMIRVQRVDGLLWAEIDDEQHLKRVDEKIWPQIRELENEINA